MILSVIKWIYILRTVDQTPFVSFPDRTLTEYSGGGVGSDGARVRCRGCSCGPTSSCERREPLLLRNSHWWSDVQPNAGGRAKKTRLVNRTWLGGGSIKVFLSGRESFIGPHKSPLKHPITKRRKSIDSTLDLIPLHRYEWRKENTITAKDYDYITNIVKPVFQWNFLKVRFDVNEFFIFGVHSAGEDRCHRNTGLHPECSWTPQDQIW